MHQLLIEFKQDTYPVDTINECIDNLIDSQDIWIKAYAVNAELPMITYNTMVLAIIEATSYMVSMCVEFVKAPSEDTMKVMIDKSALTKSKGHMIFKNIESFNSWIWYLWWNWCRCCSCRNYRFIILHYSSNQRTYLSFLL